MVTKFWRTGDGREFSSVVEAARHQQRIELKDFLLASSLREVAANNKETANTGFDDKLKE